MYAYKFWIRIKSLSLQERWRWCVYRCRTAVSAYRELYSRSVVQTDEGSGAGVEDPLNFQVGECALWTHWSWGHWHEILWANPTFPSFSRCSSPRSSQSALFLFQLRLKIYWTIICSNSIGVLFSRGIFIPL